MDQCKEHRIWKWKSWAQVPADGCDLGCLMALSLCFVIYKTRLTIPIAVEFLYYYYLISADQKIIN